MTTNELHPAPVDAADEPVADPTGQLLLLPVAPELTESTEHARFRLSKETREIGLRRVAEIRARLAATSRAQPQSDDNVVRLPPTRRPAA